MAVTAAQLVVKVNAEGVKETGEELDKAGKHAEHAQEKSGGFLSKIAEFAGGALIAQGLGDAFGFVKDNLGEMVQAGMTANQIDAQLAAGLKSTHDASGQTTDSLDKLSTSLMNQTGISDDAIKSSESMLLTFTNIGKNVFPQATQAVADLATKMNNGAIPSATQMEQASIQLGKALGNPLTGFTALQRVGVTFSAQQKEQIKNFMKVGDVAGAQNVILGEMNKEFGGAAVAAGQANGGLSILSAQFDQMKQSVGQALIPILVQLVKAVEPLIQQFGAWLPGALNTASGFINKNVLPIINQLGAWFMDKGLPALMAFGQFIMNNVVPVLGKLWTWFQTKILPILEQFGQFIVSHVLPIISQLWNWFSAKVLPVLQQLVAIFLANVLPTLESLWNTISTKLIPALERLWNKIGPLLIPVFQLLGGILQNVVGPALSDEIGFVSGLIDVITTIITKIGDFLGVLGKIKDAVGGAFSAVGGALSSLHLPGFAGGGTMQSPGLALVGENGPELVRLPGGAEITPLANLGAGLPLGGGFAGSSGMGGMGGSGQMQHIQVVLDGRVLTESVVKNMPRAVRLATGLKL